MMKLKLLLLGALAGLAGCTDNADSLAREYRNANNEGIDAMMMVTTDAHAARMIQRIFKPMGDRYNAIDKKITIMETNRIKVDLAKEFLESDGIHLYLAELTVNRHRFSLEMIRLKNLRAQYIERERELLIAQGNPNPEPDPKDVCPNLHDMLTKNEILEPLRKQLTNPELVKLMGQFPTWKVPNYEKIVAKFKERRAVFVPKHEIPLAF